MPIKYTQSYHQTMIKTLDSRREKEITRAKKNRRKTRQENHLFIESISWPIERQPQKFPFVYRDCHSIRIECDPYNALYGFSIGHNKLIKIQQTIQPIENRWRRKDTATQTTKKKNNRQQQTVHLSVDFEYILFARLLNCDVLLSLFKLIGRRATRWMLYVRWLHCNL